MECFIPWGFVGAVRIFWRGSLGAWLCAASLCPRDNHLSLEFGCSGIDREMEKVLGHQRCKVKRAGGKKGFTSAAGSGGCVLWERIKIMEYVEGTMGQGNEILHEV